MSWNSSGKVDATITGADRGRRVSRSFSKPHHPREERQSQGSGFIIDLEGHIVTNNHRGLAVGNPFGLGGSANAGIISAHGRDIPTPDEAVNSVRKDLANGDRTVLLKQDGQARFIAIDPAA